MKTLAQIYSGFMIPDLQNRYCNNDQNGKSCRGGGRGGGKGGSRGILGGARNFGLGGLLNLGK